jgi:hypothetical protein
VVKALGQRAGPLMKGRTKRECVRSRWMVLPAQFYLEDRLPADRPVSIQINGGDESIVLKSRDGQVHSRTGRISDPDLTLTGSPELALGIMMGRVTAAQAKQRGLKIDGDKKLLDRLRRRV